MTIPARKVPLITDQLAELRRAAHVLEQWGYEVTAKSVKHIAANIEREVKAAAQLADQTKKTTTTTNGKA